MKIQVQNCRKMSVGVKASEKTEIIYNSKPVKIKCKTCTWSMIIFFFFSRRYCVFYSCISAQYFWLSLKDPACSRKCGHMKNSFTKSAKLNFTGMENMNWYRLLFCKDIHLLMCTLKI